jgi:ACS family glucarate transporter-like MFS transporter
VRSYRCVFTMEEKLTVDSGDADGGSAEETPVDNGAPIFQVSQRAKMTLLMMWNIMVQLATRSTPYIAMLGPNGMAAYFGWDNTQVGYIYSGFGWAYTFTQVPGAVMSQQKGAKWTWLMFPGALCIASTMMMPILAYPFGWFGAAICRVGVGLGQGPLYPSLYNLGGLWFAPSERSMANAAVSCVWPLAQAAEHLVTPLMLDGPGWEFAFWFWGIGIMCFCYVFNKYGYDRPNQDPRMTAAELKVLGVNTAESASPPATFGVETYLRILKQPAVWGLCITTFIDGLGTPIFLNYLPQYLVTQLHFPVGSAAAIASLPLLASWFGSLVSGVLADWLVSPKGAGLSVITIRRAIYMGGRLYYAGCGLLLTTRPSASLAVFIMITQNFADGMNASGLWCNPFDISREYSGAVMGLMNMCGNLTYYALSANIIGYLLDRGKCKLSYDLPEVDALATFVNPDTNTTMFLGVDGECKSALTSCLADNEQAVIDGYRDTHEDAFANPDVQVCTEMWDFIFIGSSALTLGASFVFFATAVGDNLDHVFAGESAPAAADGDSMTKVS